MSNGLHFTTARAPRYIRLQYFVFLEQDDSMTLSFRILLTSAPTCNAPIIQKISVISEPSAMLELNR